MLISPESHAKEFTEKQKVFCAYYEKNSVDDIRVVQATVISYVNYGEEYLQLTGMLNEKKQTFYLKPSACSKYKVVLKQEGKLKHVYIVEKRERIVDKAFSESTVLPITTAQTIDRDIETAKVAINTITNQLEKQEVLVKIIPDLKKTNPVTIVRTATILLLILIYITVGVLVLKTTRWS